MDHILNIQLKRLQRLLDNRELQLHVTDAARTAICDAGFDPAFGARPLKRAITTHLMNPMSKAIVSGNFQPSDTISVDLVNDELVFQCIPGAREGEENAARAQIPQRE